VPVEEHLKLRRERGPHLRDGHQQSQNVDRRHPVRDESSSLGRLDVADDRLAACHDCLDRLATVASLQAMPRRELGHPGLSS
jgi:hypothetical protein